MMNNPSHNKQKISVVVPVYNEMGVIKQFHRKLVEALASDKTPFEILYIDDHSSDGTYTWLAAISGNISNEGTRRLRSSGYRRSAITKSFGEVKVFKKIGKKGKAFSLREGFEYATGSVFVMIDGDLQYPPEAIPEMIKLLGEHDIVIANRKKYNDSLIRKALSKTFRFFGQALFDLPTDIQSGLKVFSREVFETVKFEPESGWTFDLEFLHRARSAGFTHTDLDITFSPRSEGESKVNALKTSVEIGLNALKVKSKKISPLSIPAADLETMKGAGLGYKSQKYITHTTLPHYLSALKTFSVRQMFYLISLVIAIIAGFFFLPLVTAQIVVSVLSLLYFVDTLFFFYLVVRSLHKPEEYQVTEEEVQKLEDSYLPIYTILCPLYKEAHVVPQFVEAISRLDWPKEKLDVMLLLEEDDKETIATISAMSLPNFVRIVVVPDSLPKTKPKACNYGLAFAKGEYLVIYDAEDIPDPLQLKKAFLAFHKAPSKVQCLQAKLNYYNSRQNILTRFFTAEYSLWFDLTLTGLQSLNSALPLGGTSNHFKTKILKELQGWDPFNVTEDADLGVRLFQKGYQTAIVDSTTLEEATSKMKNWLRQRSRWLKGYMQTYLVHTRNYKTSMKEKGFFHNMIFHLSVGGKILFILLNPLMWVVTILYFAAPQLGETIELIYVPPISYIAVFSWIFGNFLFLYSYMLGIAKRGQWDLMKYVFIIPFYWLMMSIAGMIGFYQLLFKPHYWEKTLHGFHLAKKPEPITVEEEEKVIQTSTIQPAYQPIVAPVYAQTTQSIQQSIVQPAIVPVKAIPTFTFSLRNLLPTFKLQRSDTFMWQAVLLTSLLSIDITLANYFLPANELETYWMLSVVGKTGFIIAYTLSFFMTNLFAKNKKQQAKIVTLLFFTFLFNWINFVVIGLEGSSVIPYLGEQFLPIIPYLPFYTLGLMSFALANVFAVFYLKRKIYTYAILSFIITLSQVAFVSTNSDSISYFIKVLAYLGTVDLLAMIAIHANPHMVPVIQKSGWKLRSLFTASDTTQKTLSILIFNWRDTKHEYAGGAEVYIQELAGRWVKEGNNVTIFCGNDGKSSANEVIDGVNIIRRGGTYTVYLMAFVYSLFAFRGKYDVVIDCENGIPFFTPLYTSKPVILLVHHVHQQIFRAFLPFPLNGIAAFLEGKLMPLVYRNKKIVTVSNSSRNEIIDLGFTSKNNIEVIPNGVSDSLFTQDSMKTPYPSFIYLGRLKEYKNIDVTIKAFKRVVKDYPEAKFSIVGCGEGYNDLKALVSKLKLDKQITFYGRVDEPTKAALLAKSWVALQPSQMEGWGITVIEANAAGTPVIASHVNGLKDSVVDRETGILLEAGNVWAFARAMVGLIEKPSYREKLSQNAKAWAQNFSWNKSAVEFSVVITKLGTSMRQPVFANLLFREKLSQ